MFSYSSSFSIIRPKNSGSCNFLGVGVDGDYCLHSSSEKEESSRVDSLLMEQVYWIEESTFCLLNCLRQLFYSVGLLGEGRHRMFVTPSSDTSQQSWG